MFGATGFGATGIFSRTGGGRDTTPLSISNLYIWLDADNISGVAAGATFATWSDESGNARNFTGAGGVTYQTNVRNGRAIVRFDGVGGTEFALVNGTTNITSTAATLFAVFAPTSDVEYGVVGIDGAATGFWRWNGDGNGYTCTFRAVRLDAVPTVQPLTGWNYHTIQSAGSTFIYRRNSTEDINTTPNWGLSSDITIGDNLIAANELEGDVAEVILYDRGLTAGEISTIETYLINKWGF